MHILGAGGHAKVIYDILTLQGQVVSGIWDDKTHGLNFFGSEIRPLTDFNPASSDLCIVAIGNNKSRMSVVNQVCIGFGTAEHPKSAVSRLSVIDVGTVIMANASINSNSVVGRHVIINTNASVDHDCILSDFVHISPQVGLAGNVTVGEGSHIGIGASVREGINIGRWAIVGSGAVIIEDIPDFAVVVGNPGRIIRYSI